MRKRLSLLVCCLLPLLVSCLSLELELNRDPAGTIQCKLRYSLSQLMEQLERTERYGNYLPLSFDTAAMETRVASTQGVRFSSSPVKDGRTITMELIFDSLDAMARFFDSDAVKLSFPDPAAPVARLLINPPLDAALQAEPAEGFEAYVRSLFAGDRIAVRFGGLIPSGNGLIGQLGREGDQWIYTLDTATLILSAGPENIDLRW